MGVSAPKPLTVISGGPGGISRATFVELWAYREVLLAFLLRNVKVRYKQATIGVAWALIQPIFAAVLFAVFLGRLAHVPSEGSPYVVFALVGTVAWTYFATASTAATESVIAEQGLVRKVFFPREVLPLAAVGAGLVDLLPSLLLVVVVALAYGHALSPALVAIPLLVLELVLAAAALGVGLSAINTYYRDVRYALPFVIQLGLFASPIAYPLGLVPQPWRQLYAIANPAAGAIDGLRRILLHQSWPDPVQTAGGLAWSLLLLVAAYFLFKRVERGFSDRL